MSEIVSLKPGSNGGLDVPLEPIEVLWALLHRDLKLTVDGETLRISCADGSRPEFTEVERAAIVKWKPHLVALVNYVPSELT